MAEQYDAPPQMQIDPERDYRATIHTNRGSIELDLYQSASPRSVNNFVFLAREGFYNGVIFHRVIDGFMIQGGDPTGTGRGGPGYTFDDELGEAQEHGYPRGTLAMANAGPNTNGSQFFIMHRDAGLPPNYNVFGRATNGLDVVDDIATTSTDRADRPHDDIVIESIEITES